MFLLYSFLCMGIVILIVLEFSSICSKTIMSIFQLQMKYYIPMHIATSVQFLYDV